MNPEEVATPSPQPKPIRRVLPKGYVSFTDNQGRELYFEASAYSVFLDPPEKCKRCGGSGTIGGGFASLDDPEPCGCFNGTQNRDAMPWHEWQADLSEALQEIIRKHRLDRKPTNDKQLPPAASTMQHPTK